MGPRNLLVVGCWWLLREIEASHVLLGDISVSGPQVTLKLTISKTDPRGRGTSRTHTCVCGCLPGGTRCLDAALCPACTLLDQRSL
eukprot:13796925-Alexandrium_andersonii.AAC.1